MALRIRKSIKIAPGVKINLSKSGISTSLGVKGATVNLSKRGTRVTTGIPGTGISSSTLYKSKGRQVVSAQPREYSTAEWVFSWIIGEVLALIGWAKLDGGVQVLCAMLAIVIPIGLFLYYRSRRSL
ncbi:DUF4236 domain-containing protein [Pseudomonas gingeri]